MKCEFLPVLDDSRKEKLIEILLITGSILTALNLPSEMIFIFTLFLFMSILYYISFRDKRIKNSIYIQAISAVVSYSFIGVLASIFGISLIRSSPQLADMSIIITIAYYVFFGALLTTVLSKSK
jgi:hypothetical protein